MRQEGTAPRWVAVAFPRWATPARTRTQEGGSNKTAVRGSRAGTLLSRVTQPAVSERTTTSRVPDTLLDAVQRPYNMAPPSS